MKVLDDSPVLRTQPQARWMRRAVTVGLVNNMGDEALKVTERQFTDLVSMSAVDIDVQFRLFALEHTPRSPRALEYITARYDPLSAAMEGDLDALIITGAQPRTARLSEEPYWEELVDLVDWAKEHTASTILSCLAAHSAVLHLDGLERRPLPEKCTGVFHFTAQRNHPFAAWQKRAGFIPHSRYNGLSRSELERAGYEVLTSSPAHGVDSFTKSFGSQFVFLQGHPEYDANSLAREYRRDMGRYLRRETDRRPPRPKGYFNAEAEAELDAFELRVREKPGSLPMEDLSIIDRLTPTEAQWRDAAISFYRSWINMIAASTCRNEADGVRTARQHTRASMGAYQET
jgi:homoserine O-succinyltransferase/O-acetyltransferase